MKRVRLIIASIAVAKSAALLIEDTKSGINIGIKLFALCNIFPVSKLAPLAFCALVILSVSSIKVGINLNAKDITIAISCTGNLITFKIPNDFSRPSAQSLGVVVSVITDVPTTNSTSLIAI